MTVFLSVLHRIVFFCALLQKVSIRSMNVASAQSLGDLAKDPVIYYTTVGGQHREPKHWKLIRTLVELACSEGYGIQEHKIVTDDGYVLTVHRIPNGKTRPKISRSKNHYRKLHLSHHPDFDDCLRESVNETSNRIPVLFVHGILMASDGWLLQGPGYDLAYLMADSGYDVWMANIRGNFYSKKHKTMSPSDPKFWDFSFHENAIHDVPAIINYILKLTKKEKIGYVGLSMGTTIFFTMASSLPEYNDKILGFVGLAPVAFMNKENMNVRRRTLFRFLDNLMKELQKKGNVHEIFPRSAALQDVGKNFCTRDFQLQDICYDLVTVFLGYHSKLILRSKFPLYLTHVPTGTSVKTFSHYMQNMKRNSFKLFDYGSRKNVQMYGTSTPPDYPLRNITAPVALYYSEKDFFYDVKDIEALRKLLPNVLDIDIKPKFNHGDYLWSFKAKDVLYPKALSFFKKLTDQYDFQARKKKSLEIKS